MYISNDDFETPFAFIYWAQKPEIAPKLTPRHDNTIYAPRNKKERIAWFTKEIRHIMSAGDGVEWYRVLNPQERANVSDTIISSLERIDSLGIRDSENHVKFKSRDDYEKFCLSHISRYIGFNADETLVTSIVTILVNKESCVNTFQITSTAHLMWFLGYMIYLYLRLKNEEVFYATNYL